MINKCTNVLRTCDCFRENLLTLVFVILCGDVFKISIKCFIKYIIYILEAQNTFCLSERDVEIHKVFVIFTRGVNLIYISYFYDMIHKKRKEI